MNGICAGMSPRPRKHPYFNEHLNAVGWESEFVVIKIILLCKSCALLHFKRLD